MKTSDLTKWIESELKLTHGAKAGEPFKLLPWQRQFCHGAFKRGVARAALSVARGPGKTTLLAAIAAAAVKGPLRQPRGEILLVASSLDQARIAFGDACAFLGVSAPKAGLWRYQNNNHRAVLEHIPSGTKLKAIASDYRRAHGARPSLAVLDEGAQWPVGTSDAMYSAINTSLGKTAGSRLVAIGTRPVDQAHWFQRLLGDADFALCHAATAEDNPFDQSTWEKACPQLKRLPHLLKAFQAEARKAERDPALLAQFRALRLNMGVSDVVVLYLCSPHEWQASESMAAAKDGPCYWGIDLGQTAAMSAVASYWPQTGRLEALAAFPAEPDIATRERADGVKAGTYQAMVDRGELLLLGSKVVPVAQLLNAAQERLGYPDSIACDRWRLGELHEAMTDAALLAPVVARGQGYKDGSEDVRLFQTALLEGRVSPRVSLLLRSALAETRLVQDPAGNAKIAKAGEGQRRRNGRDDPAVAAVQAVALAERQPKRKVVPVRHIPLDAMA